VRLYTDGTFPTADGRANFAAVPHRPVAEARESAFPFSLTTGRLRDQWHGMSRTGTLGRLFGHVPEPSIQMNPQDMTRRGLAAGDLVRVTSKRGCVVVPVEASDELAMSQTFMAMHWGSEFLSGRGLQGEVLAGVNALTTSAHCPTSKQPEFKHAAVRIEKAALPWTLLGLAWLPAEVAHTTQQALRAFMPSFAFATCVPFGRERTGVLFRAAAAQAPAPEVLDEMERLLGLHTPNTLRYSDPKHGQRRAVRLYRQGTPEAAPGTPEPEAAVLEAFFLAGDTRSEAWIKTLLQEELPAQAYGRQLLLPGSQAPGAVASAAQQLGPQICTCFNVSQPAIAQHLSQCEGSPAQRLASLQTTLKCGTNCGSCLPQLKKLVAALPSATDLSRATAALSRSVGL
jgi:assimilatory nitrate reductase catalytic subunit